MVLDYTAGKFNGRGFSLTLSDLGSNLRFYLPEKLIILISDFFFGKII
jgi:hypothetical protein